MPMSDFHQQSELLGRWFKTPLGAVMLEAEKTVNHASFRALLW